MDFGQQPAWFGDKIRIPRPAGPATDIFGKAGGIAVPVPVHIQNHHIGRNIVSLKLAHNFAVIVGRVRGVAAVPVSEDIRRRKRYFSGYFGKVTDCFLIVSAIAQEIQVDSLRILSFGPPVVTDTAVGDQRVRTTAVRTCRRPRIVDYSPSRARNQAVLHLSPLIIAVTAVQGAACALKIQRVLLSRIPYHWLAIHHYRYSQICIRRRICHWICILAIFKPQFIRHDIYELAIFCFCKVRYLLHPPVDNGKSSAVFKSALVAILYAYHLRRQNRKARLPGCHHGFSRCHRILRDSTSCHRCTDGQHGHRLLCRT